MKRVLAWFHNTWRNTCVRRFPWKLLCTSFVTECTSCTVGNVIKQITRTGLKFNGCSRHRAYQRPALSRFSRVPFLSSHFHQVSRHRDKLYDCSFLRVPPRSTDLWSNHRSLSSSFYLFFFLSIIFFIFFYFFEIYDGAIQNRMFYALFFGRSCAVVRDEFCSMIMRFNCWRYCIPCIRYCSSILFRILWLFGKSYEFLICLFSILFFVYFNFILF